MKECLAHLGKRIVWTAMTLMVGKVEIWWP